MYSDEQEKLILSDLGMVNALGDSLATIQLRLESADASFLTSEFGLVPNREIWVGRVQVDLPKIPEDLLRYNCRNNALAMSALQQIEKEVLNLREKYGSGRIGVVMGTSTSGATAMESAYKEWLETGRVPDGYAYDQQEMGGLASFCAAYLGLTGPAYTISTACSSSAKGFSSAEALIRMDVCDAVVVGGADSLCQLTVQGFNALQSISGKPCNPLSRNRDGLTIGEGAAIFILRRGTSGVFLQGVGESLDAYHLSAPDPEGWGVSRSMERAISVSSDTHINYINLHGTATILNDRMECLAVHRLLPSVPVSSTKPFVGHTLGAAGAMEVGFCWMALQFPKNGCVTLPPHIWDGQRDPTLPFVPIVEKDQSLVARGELSFLSNSFGFGGNNCSVLISKRYDTM